MNLIKKFLFSETKKGISYHNYWLQNWGKNKKISKQKKLQQLENLIKNFDFEYKLLNEYFLIQKNDKKSIIQKIHTNGQNFYSQLNKIFSSNFEIPFFHITLFGDGIGIYSEKDFLAVNFRRLSDD